MVRHRFSFLALACGVAVGGVALLWNVRFSHEAVPEPAQAVVLWQPREPDVAVLARPPANARQPWMRHVSAVMPIALPAGLRLEEGVRLSLPLPDERVAGGVIRRVRTQADGGEIAGGRLDDGGTFTLGHRSGRWTGVVLPKDGATVYRIFQADDGGMALASVPRESVLCASLPRGPRTAGGEKKSRVARTAALEEEVPLLDSRPEAEPVIFLDFDGATVTDPFWNGGETIEAAHSGLSAGDMVAVWRRVAEDYAPFHINVTTDPARYAAARPMQRMRCIITATSWDGDDIGGVAGLFSWPEAGVEFYTADVPSWAFTFAGSEFPVPAEDIALAVSHEVGHTFGLYHDGAMDESGEYWAEYYEGHGSGATSWGPIMGAPYGRSIIQWSHGGYKGQMFGVNANGDMLIGDGFANNDEDDIAIIASIVNHTGFARDHRATTVAEAGRLAIAGDGTTVEHTGLIETGGAESWLFFAAGAGPLELRVVAPEAEDEDATNVDGTLTLTDFAGNVLATADDPAGRFPTLTTHLPAAGTYVLRVASTGEGDPTNGGYPAYGSAGRFRVQGTVTAGAGVAPVVGGAPRVEGRVGETIYYAIEAAGVDLVYSATGLPPGLTVGADGAVSGMPTQAGIFSVEIAATNPAGGATRTVVFAVATDDLAVALDAPFLAFATGGDRPWRTVSEPDAPTGGSAARSGEVLDGYQQSWIETELRGPGRLRWRWKVSSEEDYDFYHALLDGEPVATISGNTAWEQAEIEIQAGAHTLRWSYDKDPYFSDFQDSAWLDDVRWDRGFEFWAEAAELTGEDTASDADPDGDGVPNLLEYAFALSPSVADGLGGTVSVAPSEDPEAEGALEIVFDRPANRLDLRYVVEVSGDLLTWERGHAYGEGSDNSGILPTLEVSREPLGGEAERVRVRDTISPTAEPGANRRFIRVRVERI